jgi:hypothetical protein
MSSSINLNLNLTGVGDEIAAAAVDAIRKQQATSESSVLIGKEIAKQIGKEVSEHVAVALKTALADLQKPALDLREQILGMYCVFFEVLANVSSQCQIHTR